MVMNLYKIKIP
jgi:hypothetical protein